MTRRNWMIVLAGLLLLAGGTPGTHPTYQHYVALGDSFTAGPFIPTTALAAGCLRSDHNYPSLVADRLKIADFTDVSCSAARTRDLTHRQIIFGDNTVPPQLSALTPRTNLVTLGIGGNDFGLFARALASCTTGQPPASAGFGCGSANPGPLDRQMDTLSRRIAAVLQQIERRSPQARVILVGYLQLTPNDGTMCPRLLPIAEPDYPRADAIARQLRSAMARAAMLSGDQFIDMYAASTGHNICSKDPWVNGQTTDRGAALAYHPFGSGMRAVTQRIVAALD